MPDVRLTGGIAINSPHFKDQPRDSVIASTVSQIVAFGKGDQIYTSGTATCIAHNVHITAAHVLTDLLEDQFGFSGNQTHFNLWLVQVMPGPEYIIWQAISFWICPYSDLAIIYTSPYNSEAAELKPILCLKMQLAPPSIGERVVGFGFHSSDTSRVFLNDDGGGHIEIEGIGAATVGHVKDVHQIKRDSARLTFPCYQVDARFDGGMSGGPILNDDGEMCGVICSTLPPLTDDEEHVSYVATLWPAMAISLNVNIETGKLDSDYYPLLNLVDMNVLAAKSSDRVVIKKVQGDIRYAIEFKVQ